MRPNLPSILLLLWALSATALAAPQDYSDKDLSVRLPTAFVRFMEVPTLGGQTVANRWSSAINPASTAWTEIPTDAGVVLAPYYRLVDFETDIQIHVGAVSATWDTESFGTWQPTFTALRSDDGTTNQGLTFDYEVYSVQLQGGERFGDWAAGAGLEYSNAAVGFENMGMRVSDSDANSFRCRAGGLYEWDDHWLAGLVVEYGYAPSTTDALVDVGGGIFQPVTIRDINRQFLIRPGVSLEYKEGCTVYLDYLFGYFHNDRDLLHLHRFNLGTGYRIREWIYARGDVAVDIRGNVSFTAGVTVHFATWGSFDLGYSYDAYPELQPEFGRSHTFQGILAFRF